MARVYRTGTAHAKTSFKRPNRLEHGNHAWSYDFLSTRTHDGRAMKMLTVLHEDTQECVAIKVAREIRAHDVHEVHEVLAELFARHGPPEHLRSGNGPEFTSGLVRRWLA